MIRKIIILFVVLISQSKLNAQASFAELENNKIMYPSPTAASLGRYGEYPVSLYNGLVNIGQDIVTVKSGRLAMTVSLSYHASGNKPADIPGWVGLGFSLNAGGVITRIVKDQPDDLAGGFYADNTGVQYLWNTYPNSEFIEQYFSGSTDPRSDVYQFNFGGRTGEFIFDWDRHIHFKQQVPFKIQELYGSGGFAGFKITTDDGTIYTFDQAERSNIHFEVLDNPASAWYLTKVSNLSGDSIVLKYTAPLSKFRYKQYSTRKEVNGTILGAELVTAPTINLNTSRDEVIYLEEIDFNNGKLVFGTSTRTDPCFIPAGLTSSTVQEKKLDLITLQDNSDNVIKKWKFEYFENGTERLKLKNLIVEGADQAAVQKYSFEYNLLKLPLPLPGPNPNVNPYLTNSVDFWGYYNGIRNDENRIPKIYIAEYNTYWGHAERSIGPAFAKAEILEKIIYPTGGYTSFEYESNDYSTQGESFASDQNPLFTTTGTATEIYEFIYNRDEGGFEIDPATISFTLTEPAHINIKYSCGADGNNHAWADPWGNYDYDYQISAGTHTLQQIFRTDDLLLFSSSDITKAHGLATVYKTGGEIIPIKAKTGPGLRIKSITTNDGNLTRTRRFEYRIAQDPDRSSGILSVFPAFYAPLQRFALNMQGVYVSSDPINDIGEGLPVGYSRVVERFQDNSSIVHTYTNYGGHPDEMMPFLNGYSDSRLAHMTSNSFWRGLETGTSYYNGEGILQKRISNSYDTLPGSLTNVQAIELKPTVGIISGGGSEVNKVNATLTSVYNTQSCFLYHYSTTEEVFDKNGENPIATSVYRHYENVKHLQPARVQTINSDGSTLTTARSFPDDFAPGVPFIDYMQANHLTSFPVEQVTYRQKEGVNNIVSGNIITYKTEGAGLPDRLLNLETAGPLSQASFKFSNGSMGALPPLSQPLAYNADTHYQPVLTYTQYDGKGKPLESVGQNGIRTTYLWGYRGELPVAKIIGSDYGTVMTKISQLQIDAATEGNGDESGVRNLLNTLRTAFADAPEVQVSTYTYRPLVGMTSETDPTGRTTYYEYDGFGRLNLIKDDQGNVVKKYCYNYAGQAIDCNSVGGGSTMTYYNVAKSQNFTRNNCGSGYTGSQVAYVVAAGGYSSTISQADADQKAENDINANGQDYANTHGVCEALDVSVYGENDHGTGIDIQLHNVSSGQDYWYFVEAHSADVLGDVPPGNYTITITPQSSGGWYNYSVGCGYYGDGPGAFTFYGVDINSGCNNIIIN